MEKNYDLIILGGGPASMSAGVYAKQMKLDTLLIEKSEFGGQVAITSSVDNYLGFENISGKDLSKNMHNHLLSTGIEIINEEIVKTELVNEIKVVHTHNNTYHAKSVIIGIGTTARKLGVENEQKYLNRGISYTTLKDREKYEDKIVAVVGGGNSAIEGALYLAEKCRKVYLIHRRNEFRADAKLVDTLHKNIANNSKIELVLDCKPHSIQGEFKVEKFNVTHIPTENIRTMDIDCIFVAIGRGADTDIIDESIIRNDSGYIVTNEKMETNIDGVYEIGDIRTTPLRQIVTAVADGAIAVVSALGYIKQK